MDNTSSDVVNNQEYTNNFITNTIYAHNLNNQRYSVADLDTKSEIENLLDENTKNLVKKVFQSYQVLEVLIKIFFLIFNYFLFLKNIQTVPNKILNHEHDLALELVRLHTEKCISFISNISCNLLIKKIIK